MQNLLNSPDAGGLIFMSFVVVCVAIVVLGRTIAVQWRKHRQVEIQSYLTKEMVEAGMSADEIVRVLQAATESDELVRVLQAAKGKSPGNPTPPSVSKAMSGSNG